MRAFPCVLPYIHMKNNINLMNGPFTWKGIIVIQYKQNTNMY